MNNLQPLTINRFFKLYINFHNGTNVLPSCDSLKELSDSFAETLYINKIVKIRNYRDKPDKDSPHNKEVQSESQELKQK